MSYVKWPSRRAEEPGGAQEPGEIGHERQPWERSEHNRQLATFLRRFADQVERDGLPTLHNLTPGFGDVVLFTDSNRISGEEQPGGYDEAVLDCVGGKIQVLVGPRGINNCFGVLVLPLQGHTVRVRAEEKP
ncbi:MAG: hypothetical protein JXB32_24825 [Deltaproteobacteria bacterium]|nr:hypothetical protein [Deltaproteobacteria bacterium]